MTDDLPATRIAQLEEVWGSIAELAAELDDADWDRATDLPGWTAKDCLSHLVGTELMLLGEAVPEVAVDHLDHIASPMQAFVELPVEARRAVPAREVVAEWAEVHPRRIRALRELSDEAWEEVGPTPIGDAPYHEFMAVRVFDSWMHEQDIRRAVGHPGQLDGVGAAHSVGRVVKGLGFIVGKRAAAPEGTTVVFVVEGPAGGTFAVEVADRARRTDAVPDDPDVRLTLDVEAFCALGGGRWSGDDVVADDRVRIEGDVELAERILAGMAITP